MTFILFSILACSMYYLGSRATVTSWLWSRYPASFARFMDCPACSGFWYGVWLSVTIGRLCGLSYLGLDPYSPLTPFLVGLCTLTTTPIVAAIMLAAFDRVGSAVGDDHGE